jgi:hypothetical protein
MYFEELVNYLKNNAPTNDNFLSVTNLTLLKEIGINSIGNYDYEFSFIIRYK